MAIEGFLLLMGFIMPSVLILLLMEYGHRVAQKGLVIGERLRVLILLLMEYGHRVIRNS